MYEPTAAYMNPLKSGTAPTSSTPSAPYDHEPISVLNGSITVPTRWNRTITRSSRSVSSLYATIRNWITTAATVRTSLRASPAPSGYQSLAAISTARSAAPKMQAQPCLSPKTMNSVSLALAPLAGAMARKRWARSSIRRSNGVELRTDALVLCRLRATAEVLFQFGQAVVLEPVPDAQRQHGVGHRKDAPGPVVAALVAFAPGEPEVLAQLLREEPRGKEPRGRHDGPVPKGSVLGKQQSAAHAHALFLGVEGGYLVFPVAAEGCPVLWPHVRGKLQRGADPCVVLVHRVGGGVVERAVDLLDDGQRCVVKRGCHPELKYRVEGVVACGRPILRTAYRNVGTVDPAPDFLDLLLGSVHHAVHVGERALKPVDGAFGERAVRRHPTADRRVGQLQQDGPSCPGEQDAFCPVIGGSLHHGKRLPECCRSGTGTFGPSSRVPHARAEEGRRTSPVSSPARCGPYRSSRDTSRTAPLSAEVAIAAYARSAADTCRSRSLGL